MDTIPRKRCIKCGKELPATREFFFAHAPSKDGLLPRCKTCFTQYREKRPVVPEEYKRCSRCKTPYPATLAYFHACESRRDHLNVYCKQCQHDIQMAKYAKAKTTGPKEPPPNTLTCKRCGESKPANSAYFCVRPTSRYGLSALCKECFSKAGKVYRKSSRKRRYTWEQEYARVHKERLALYHRQRYQAKRTHILRQQQAFKQANPEVVRTWHHRYSKSPKGRVSHAASEHNRRARKQAVPGTHTTAQIQEQLKRQHYRCYYAACGHAKFQKVRGKYDFHIEHTFPLSRVAGAGIPANDMGYLVLACEQCNLSKGKKFPWEWPEGGRLL